MRVRNLFIGLLDNMEMAPWIITVELLAILVVLIIK